METLHHHYHCGGALIKASWVLTSANCVYFATPEEMMVKFGGVTNELSTKEVLYHIKKKVIPNGYMNLPHAANDIALLKLSHPIKKLGVVIPLCSHKSAADSLLGSCGTNSSGFEPFPDLSAQLLEAYFTEDRNYPNSDCRPDLICPEPTFYDSAMTSADSGSPLYAMFCGTRTPKCLYGIFSHSLPGRRRSEDSSSSTQMESRNNRVDDDSWGNTKSFFSSVPYFSKWIKYAITSG
ncbi:tryptase gamma-like [Convolutriloba macropyga]|uniref:tryptase gamma-like n=1 Tax=Convolutriloba macropyga TaxID=536237 RepID=UPI003F51DD1B